MAKRTEGPRNEDREGESLLVQRLGSSPRIRIIDFLLDNFSTDFTKKEISESLRISMKTFTKNFERLEADGAVVVRRKIGRAKLFSINLKDPLIRYLRAWEIEESRRIADEELEKHAVKASA